MSREYQNSLLIVDDMASNRLTDVAVIQEHFPSLIIHQATGVVEALQKLSETPIDLVLSDIYMPHMDGFDLATTIEKDYPNTSIILLTASDENEELEKRGIAVGAIDFIHRPYNPNTLIKRIKLYLNLYKKHHELQQTDLENRASLDLINRYVIASKTDLKGVITEVTDAFCDISGYRAEELIGKPHNIVRHKDMPKETFKEMWQSIKKGNIWSGEVKNRRKNGGFYWVHAVVSPMINKEGKHIGYISTRQDITKTKEHQLELFQRKEQLKAEIASRQSAEDLVHEVIDSTDNMVAVTTLNEPIFFNRAMLQFINQESVESFKIQYSNLDNFFSKHPEMMYAVEHKNNWLDTMYHIDGDTPIVMQAIGQNSKRMYKLQIKRLQTQEERYLFSFSDVTDLEEERQYYQEMATHDSLTGLYNRFYFIDSIKREMLISTRDKRPLSLMMLDIDHFKSINDTYGHDVGDDVLKTFAETIKHRLRESDVLARWGGEEFIVMLPTTALSDAIHVAESIRESVALMQIEGVRQITCSIGISTLAQSDDVDQLVKRADNALYEAKESGRNRVVTGN